MAGKNFFPAFLLLGYKNKYSRHKKQGRLLKI